MSIFGNPPWLKDIFIMSLKGFENSFLNSFKILVGILFEPLALFVFVELIRSSMSSGTVGERKIVFLFSGPRYERWVFFALTMFVYFFCNTCIKVIKVLWNLFGTGYWLSIRRLEIDSSDLFFMFTILFMACDTSFRFFCCHWSIFCNKILLSP